MREELLKALKEGNLYGFICQNYHHFTKEELKDIIKELDFALWDRDKDTHESVTKAVMRELEESYAE